MYERILEISKILKKSRFFFNFDMSQLTWFKAGGKTDIYCIVFDENDLQVILHNIQNIPYLIIGAGSNLLIRDGGYRGLIIKLGKSFNQISFNDDETRSGTITITNGDGKWVRKRNLDHLDICEPGLDELDRISGMTLEEYREDKLTVIRFS